MKTYLKGDEELEKGNIEMFQPDEADEEPDEMF
jgi:hypothetical protein